MSDDRRALARQVSALTRLAAPSDPIQAEERGAAAQEKRRGGGEGDHFVTKNTTIHSLSGVIISLG